MERNSCHLGSLSLCALASMQESCEAKRKEGEALNLCLQGFQVPPLPAACRKEFAQGTSAPPQRVQKRTKLVPDPPILVGRANWSNAPSTSTARSAQTAAYMARKKKKPACRPSPLW